MVTELFMASRIDRLRVRLSRDIGEVLEGSDIVLGWLIHETRVRSWELTGF